MWNTCAGSKLTEEDVLGLRSMYRRKTETLSIHGINAEQCETIKVTAKLALRPWLGAIEPMSQHQPKPFGWDDTAESNHAVR